MAGRITMEKSREISVKKIEVEGNRRNYGNFRFAEYFMNLSHIIQSLMRFG